MLFRTNVISTPLVFPLILTFKGNPLMEPNGEGEKSERLSNGLGPSLEELDPRIKIV